MVGRRYELTDREWSIIAPLLPNKPRGVPRGDDRRVLNGILWRFRTGSPWTEIPQSIQKLDELEAWEKRLEQREKEIRMREALVPEIRKPDASGN